MKAICVGHSTYDTTLPMNEYPTENIKYRIENHIECGGGPASNGAYLLAKWGIDTTICSVIGDDYYGTKIIEDFEKIGANTKYLEVKEQINCDILSVLDRENIPLVYPTQKVYMKSI